MMLDAWFDNNKEDVYMTARWVERDGEITDELYIGLRDMTLGEWTHMDYRLEMIDHLLNDWVMSTVGNFYRCKFPNDMVWVYCDKDTFENLRDTVLDMVRRRELDEVTDKFAQLTAKGL